MPTREAFFRIGRALQALGLALLVAGAPGASPADAAGRISLSWNGCSPIVSDISSDGAHPYSAYVSVIGQSELHTAYQWYAYLRRVSDPYPFPDAWRFDALGCQTSGLIRIDHLPSATLAKTCPAFAGAGPATTQIKEFSFNALTSRATIRFESIYPNGVAAVDPNTRYFLGRVEFDHTFSVVGPGTPGADPGSPALTCGGFEADMRLSFLTECSDPRFCTQSYVNWLDPQGVGHAFEIENPTLTFCGSCGPTPAVRSTWGAIKGQYRR